MAIFLHSRNTSMPVAPSGSNVGSRVRRAFVTDLQHKKLVSLNLDTGEKENELKLLDLIAPMFSKNTLAVNPSGTIIVAVLGNHGLAIIDANTNTLCKIVNISGFLTFVAWSPDGQDIGLSGSNVLSTLDACTFSVRASRKFSFQLRKFAFSHATKQVVVIPFWKSDIHICSFLDLSTKSVIRMKGIFGYEPIFITENLIAISDKDNSIRIWDVDNNKCVNSIQNHTDEIKCFAVSPNRKIFISGGLDRKFNIYDSSTFVLIKSFNLGGSVYSVQFIDDDTVLMLIGYSVCQLFVIDIKTTTVSIQLEGNYSYSSFIAAGE